MTVPSPLRTALPQGDPARADLLDKVKDALQALPAYFSSGTHIEGLEAGDLFNLNSVLGSSIEVQVVDSLNKIRRVWDPGDEWPEYRFERSSQSFPDVRLISRSGEDITTALGIELKGWYILAREGEPSFRYTVTPAACSPYDLLVVVPWHLKNVLSGVPVVYEPYIEQACYVAEFRNHWWEYVRQARGGNTTIQAPTGEVTPYPPSKFAVNDKPASDSGNNFGRIARVGLMDSYVNEILAMRVSGIEAQHWVAFFKLYAEARDPSVITRRLDELLRGAMGSRSEEDAKRAVEILTELATLLGTDA